MGRESLTILSLALLLLSISQEYMTASTPTSDRQKAGYLGPVHKAITENETLSRKLYRESKLVEDTTGQFGNGRYLEAEEEFDESGRLIADSSSDREMDQEPFRHMYHYDGTGRLSEEIHFNRDGSPAGKKQYVYDSAGRKAEELSYDVNGELFSRLQYDGQQNLTRMDSFRPDGSLIEKQSIVHSYHREGNILVDSYSTANLGLVKDLYAYNEAGQLMKKSVGGYETSYDANGRATEEKLGDIQTTHSYDEQGRLTETLVHDSSAVEPVFGRSMRSVFKYDSRGNELERTVYRGDGSVLMHYDWTYEYDSHGNWTKRIEEEKVFNAREDFKPSTLQILSAVYRTIFYQ